MTSSALLPPSPPSLRLHSSSSSFFFFCTRVSLLSNPHSFVSLCVSHSFLQGLLTLFFLHLHFSSSSSVALCFIFSLLVFSLSLPPLSSLFHPVFFVAVFSFPFSPSFISFDIFLSFLFTLTFFGLFCLFSNFFFILCPSLSLSLYLIIALSLHRDLCFPVFGYLICLFPILLPYLFSPPPPSLLLSLYLSAPLSYALAPSSYPSFFPLFLLSPLIPLHPSTFLVNFSLCLYLLLLFLHLLSASPLLNLLSFLLHVS